jgi:hypothetical protein
MIFSIALSVNRAQLVRSNIRRCSYVLLRGRFRKAESDINSQPARRSSRRLCPFLRSAVIGSFPINLHWWRSISRMLGQFSANAVMALSSS